MESVYSNDLYSMVLQLEDERMANQRYIDEVAHLARNKEDLSIRLRNTEERLGGLLRENRTLQDQVRQTETSLQYYQKEYENLKADLRKATEQCDSQKKETDRYKDLYEALKENTDVEMRRMDVKAAQLEKLVLYLQCQLTEKKKFQCCRRKKIKPASLADLKMDGDTEQSKPETRAANANEEEHDD